MAKSRVRESTREIADEIERAIREQEAAQLEAAVDKQAEEMKAYAVSISPVDTGQYKKSFEISKVERSDGLPARSLSNTDPIAGLLEYGSIHNPEFAVLARTAHQFGGTVDRQ
jgi:hypothetical protein